MQCAAALHFLERNATVISYGIQTNSTPVAKRGKYEDPTLKFQIPLQFAAEREIARLLMKGINMMTFVVLCYFLEFILVLVIPHYKISHLLLGLAYIQILTLAGWLVLRNLHTPLLKISLLWLQLVQPFS